MEKLAGSSRIFKLANGIDIIDFAEKLKSFADSSDAIQSIQILSEHDGKSARVSWQSKFTDISDAKFDIDMYASASGAEVPSNLSYKKSF